MIRLLLSIVLFLTIGFASMAAGQQHSIAFDRAPLATSASHCSVGRLDMNSCPEADQANLEHAVTPGLEVSMGSPSHDTCEAPDGHSCSPGFGLTAITIGHAVYQSHALRVSRENLMLHAKGWSTLLRPPIFPHLKRGV